MCCQLCDDLAVCPRHHNEAWDPWFKDVSELSQEKRDRDMSSPDFLKPLDGLKGA